MRPAELAKMYELEDTYWWFVARRELVRELLLRYRPQGERLRILDVGCGTGATLTALEDLGELVAVDRSTAALHFCRRRGFSELVLANAEKLPVASGSADVVLALDLLEHIEDDASAAREIERVLRPGGIAIITVPALPGLWSEHDEALDHLRRYRAGRLKRILAEAGFEIEKLSPVITALLLPIAGLRLVQRVLPKRAGTPETAFIIPPKSINRLLIGILRLERVWLRYLNLPVGVSLVAVARKP